jgi:hypothetical protein
MVSPVENNALKKKNPPCLNKGGFLHKGDFATNLIFW